MRRPEYLSPSSVQCYDFNADEFYLRYLASTKTARAPQTKPMAVGSAFDAYIKNYLHTKLFGTGHKESARYALPALLESQIESHNRAWAAKQGKYLFDRYRQFGGLADLMLDLEKAIDEPRMEFDLKGVVSCPEGPRREGEEARVLGIPILGKPDLRFISSGGAHVIVDFKVNGYCRPPISPMPGYLRCRDGWSYLEGKETRGPMMHKDCIPEVVDGIKINVNCYMEQVKPDWALQLSTYSWLMGEQVGRENIQCIEQVVGKEADAITVDGEKYPSVRFACHRLRTSSKFQFECFEKYRYLWSLINTEPFHYFRHLSLEESQQKCALLDKQAEAFANATGDDAWLMQAARWQE